MFNNVIIINCNWKSFTNKRYVLTITSALESPNLCSLSKSQPCLAAIVCLELEIISDGREQYQRSSRAGTGFPAGPVLTQELSEILAASKEVPPVSPAALPHGLLGDVVAPASLSLLQRGSPLHE